MYCFNLPSALKADTTNIWNDNNSSAEFASNASPSQHDYYESKMVFDEAHADLDDTDNMNCVVTDHLDDAISFLGTNTALLTPIENDPISIRVVWNLLENISRVYLPKARSASELETVCLSVKGDPYAVRENGVMLDALNYVRMMFSENTQAASVF